MNYLFLRGRMERHKECSWKTLDECTDMWTHLFAGIVGEEDKGDVLYSNGTRVVTYRENLAEFWFPSFKDWDYAADVIIARGGFKEYVPLLKKYPKAKKIYYGANHGLPKDGIKYDLVLCDSPEQQKKAKKRGFNAELFIKPAAPQFFPRNLNKKYDVGFSAIWPKNKRKNVAWVHKTAPKSLKILQMGHSCKAPSNFSVKMIENRKMPHAISKCKVIIAPYTSEDSCPRIIPEALACGVPVVALHGCQYWYTKYPVNYVCKSNFWHIVKEVLRADSSYISDIYKNDLSIEVAAKHLRSLICG